MPVTTHETELGADAAADTSTLLSVAVGGTAQGTIGFNGDHDFFAVTLEVGRTYSFAMVGIGADILRDAQLTLRAADGVTSLASNDDGLQNKNAVFQFTATNTGTYYLDAQGFGTKTGQYGVSVTEGTKASFDAAMIAGAIDTHLSWSATRGTGTTLTYGFSDTFTGGYTTFQHFTEAEKEVVRSVLAHLAELTNLTFTEINPGGFTDEAVLLYGNYDADDGAGAWGGYPGDTAFTSSSGNVWVNDATPPTENIDFSSWFYAMMLHEVGHTMGLSHPGKYNAGVGVSTSYAVDAQFLQDSEEFTVMSYFDSDATGASDLNPDGFGLYDILALQQIYGANTSTRTEDTTYGFGSNAPRIYDFDANTTPKFTIWDAGGHDRLDASRYSADQRIDLGEGRFSDIGGSVRNVSVAYGVTLEDAIGGRGADTLIGNGAANLLQGGDSDDSLSGGDGHDTLQGQGGADTLLGGTGNDLLLGDDAGQAPAPEEFHLISTDKSANAKLHLGNTPLFPLSSFTLELIWKQLDLADEHYSAAFGNLSIYRDADGTASLMFWDALEQGWSYGILPDALTDGEPHRLSLTYDDGAGLLIVYLDGTETDRKQFTPGTRMLSVQDDIDLDDDAAYGDIRLFDAVRTPQEIWDHAWQRLPDPANTGHLIGNWVGNAAGQLISALPGQTGFTASGPVGHMLSATWHQGTGNRMEGGDGDDSYEVRSSADTVIEAAAQGNDSVTAFADFTLGAGQEVEHLAVGMGRYGLRLTGNALANHLISASDAPDTLLGGGGNDVYEVNSAGDQVVEAANGGDDTVLAYANFTLSAASHVEALRVSAGFGLALSGNELANTLYSGAGSDTLAGGAGNDSYHLNSAADRVVEATGAGDDTIYASATYTLAAGVAVETLVATGASGITLSGNERANLLISSAASDTLAGGAGNDSYQLNTATDQIVESATGGEDTLFASVSYALSSGVAVEVMRASGSLGLALSGNERANTLFSGIGSDTLAGGAGNDIYHLNDATDQVVETTDGGEDTLYTSASYALGTGIAVEVMRASGPAGLALSGNELANTLYSGSGADTLAGGAGDDTYYVNDPTDQLREALNAGNDTVFASTSFALSAGSAVETLRAAATQAIKLTGNAFANVLYSGAGSDTLAGGAGDDIYYLNAAADRVTEAAGAGFDTLYTATAYALQSGVSVEALYGSGSAGLALTGNELANRLMGGLGKDTLSGGAGNDVYILNNREDRVTELASAGTDTVQTAFSHSLSAHIEILRGTGPLGLRLTGNAEANRIYGTQGADTLRGGAGSDQLYGGQDQAADRFVFAKRVESAVGTLRDRVYEFTAGLDEIDLAKLDANSRLAGDQAFHLAEKATAFALWSVTQGVNLILRADVTGDKLADFEIALIGLRQIEAGDLIL